ncbi:MAG: 30S ribosomal protein S6 [Chloroflexota bacterium]|nr:30S ribosomal protein S6 [Chloroflexota bacterium]
MRRYELMLLLRPDLEDDKLQSAVEKVTRAIVNAGGSLSKVSPWGKRRLAYEIQHFRDASYFLIHFDIDPSEVRGIERGLLISEEILRHLVIVLEDRGAGAEDDELIPAVAERQAEGDEPAAEASDAAPRLEPVEAESVDYESEIAEAPTAELSDEAGAPEPAEQPLAQA